MNIRWLPLVFFSLACYNTGRVYRGYSSPSEREEEYSVYAAVRATRFSRDSVVFLSERTFGPLFMRYDCGHKPRSEQCHPEIVEALDDLDAKPDVKLRAFDSRQRIVLVPRAKVKPQTCHGPTRYSISRVGFNKRRDVAIVGVSESMGSGPYPGCGYASGGVIIYRRKGNSWTPAGGFGQFIT